MRQRTPALPVLLTALYLIGCAGGPAPRRSEPRVVDTTGDLASPGAAQTRPAETIRISNESSVSAHVVEAPLERVWTALQEVYQELELPVSRFEPAEGFIGNDGFNVRRIDGRRMSRYLDCGQGMTGPHADDYAITMSLYTVVDTHGQGTELVIDLDAMGRPRDTAGNTVHCVSEGRLEALILERLEARLARAR